MPSIKFDTIIETAKVVSGFRDIQNAVHQTAEKVEKDGKSIDDIISNIQNSFNIAIGGWSIGKFVNQMMQVRGQFQQTEMAFKTMLQSEEKADELMKQMIHTAAITPFGVEDVTEGAKQLLAFNVAAEDVNKTLIGLGDVAAGMGLNLSDMVMLYGTTIAKGKMDTMDMYQFLNRGIPIADELAKVMGLDLNNAIGEVSKQIKAGKVTSDVFIQAMQNMTAEGSKFGGLMEEQSKTITGQISNIEDAIEQMFNELGRSQEGVINTGLDIVSTLVENWEKVGQVLLTVVSAYGAYKAAVIAMIAIEKVRIALNSAQAFISLARSITSAKDAMALFNLVCSANTLGLVLGVVAAGVTAFKLFGDTTADISTQTKKFGEDAAQSTKHVESLLAILKTAKKDSKVYSDTVKELSGIYSNYGIELTKIKDDESNLNAVKDEAIKKSQQLVEQIKLESVERNRANAISQANERYNDRISKAQESLADKLESYGSQGGGIAVGIQNIVTNDVINRFAELANKMQGLNEHSKEYQKYLKEYNQLEGSLIDESEKLANSFGYTGDKTKDARKALIGYLYELRAGKKVYDDETSAINQGANATENFSAKNATAADRVREIQRQLQKAGEDVHTLYGRVKTFMENYADNDIKFHVKFDAETPAWMKNMDIPELGRLGKYFSALAKDLANNNKSGAKVNGKWMSRDDIAQRGYDYSKAANDKQTEKEEKAKKDAKAKADAEEEAKKKAKEAKKAASDAKKKAEDQRKAQEELNEDLKQLRQQNIDDEISQMREGTEKKLKEIDNDYKKRLAEIDKQETEFKKKNKEAGKSSALTKEQTDALADARKLAEKDYNKQTAEVYKDQVQALNDYLKEYGTFKEKQLAIAEEYDKKIRDAEKNGNTFEAMSLRAQKQKEIGSNRASQLESQIDYTTVFGEFGIVLKDQMQAQLATMKEFVKTQEFKSKPINEQKDFLQRMSQIEQKYGTSEWKDSSFVKLGKLIDTYAAKLKKRNELEEKLNKSSEELLGANKEYQDALVNGTEEQKKNAKKKLDAATAENEIDRTALQNADAEVAEAQNNVTDAATRLQNTLTSVDNLLSSMKSGSLTSVWNAFTDFDKKINNGKVTEAVTKSLSKVLGKAFEGKSDLVSIIIGAVLSLLDVLKEQGIGGLVGGLIDSILGAIDGIIDNILSGEFIEQIVGAVVNGIGKILDNVIGRIGNVVTFGAASHKGPSSWFKNSNEEEVAERRDALIAEAEKLTNSIEALKNELQKQSGAKAIETANELVELQKQKIENARNQLINENDYHNAHHSNTSYWNENAFEVYDQGSWAEVTKALQEYKQKNANAETVTDTAYSYEDLLKLTPEQLDYIRTHYAAQWWSIKEVGKYNASDEKWEALADLAGTLDETMEDLRESLTQTSFDSLKDSFVSTLMDMDASASDFADNFSEYLMKAVVSAQVSNLLEDEMQKFYKDWATRAEANSGNLTTSDVTALKEQWDKLVEQGLAIRDQASLITGYTGSTSQSATSGGWSSMGQDTADELNGRFTALQIAGESIAQNMADTVSQMQSIVTLGISTNGAVLEIRNMMIMTNSYLEDVVKYAKLTYNDFSSKLDDMNKRLKEI